MRTVRDAGCAPIVVVLGAAAEQVQSDADLGEVTVVVNKAWVTGVGSSLRCGLTAVDEAGADAVLVVPVDMPGITADALRRVAATSERDALACATFDGRRSHPILLGRDHWAGMSTLANGDVGVRPYLLARSAQVTEVACDEIAVAGDVDTPEDATRWGIQAPAPADT